MKFPDVSKPETLDRKYIGKMSKQALAFVKALLKMDPKERLASEQALMHPYFDGLRDPNDSIFASK